MTRDDELLGAARRQAERFVSNLVEPAVASLRDEPAEPEPTYRGLTPSEILKAKADHDAEGHTSESTHGRLRMSKSSLVRARHALGLVPWPPEKRYR